MKIKITVLLFSLFSILAVTAQTPDKKETTMSKKDSLRLAKYKAKGIYPAIKASKFCGVLPVEGITDKADASLKYKLVISLTTVAEGDKINDINRGLAEVGRIINLHLAAGVPKENLDVVIVTHSKALLALLNNQAFKKQFKVDNPNIAIINELESTGAKFVACGQAMGFLEIKNSDLLPTVKVALAAKVALSTYQLKGYTLFEVDEE